MNPLYSNIEKIIISHTFFFISIHFVYFVGGFYHFMNSSFNSPSILSIILLFKQIILVVYSLVEFFNIPNSFYLKKRLKEVTFTFSYFALLLKEVKRANYFALLPLRIQA